MINWFDSFLYDFNSLFSSLLSIWIIVFILVIFYFILFICCMVWINQSLKKISSELEIKNRLFEKWFDSKKISWN